MAKADKPKVKMPRRRKTPGKLKPTIIKGIPDAPAWMMADAKSEWVRVCGELDKMGILASADLMALQTLCQTFAQWVAAEQYLTKHGTAYMTTTREGMERWTTYPQVAVARECRNTLGQLYKVFGLQPAARATIGLEMGRDKKEGDPVVEKHFGQETL